MGIRDGHVDLDRAAGRLLWRRVTLFLRGRQQTKTERG